MRVILHRGGNYSKGGHSVRYEPSEKPQEVVEEFGRMMLGRGPAFAEKAPEKAKTARPAKTTAAAAVNQGGQ